MSSGPSNPACGTCAAPAAPDARFCARCGATLTRADLREAVRRHVVVLFADLVGFTSMSEGLDPEALRTVMDRYFGLVSRIIWDNGGATEKFIGDAVMAVFGMPQVAEDDAVRAVQAGVEIISALEPLNVELRQDFGLDVAVRIGVHSGPVSATYDRSGDFRIVGDIVNTASRLQSAAPHNRVLVGEAVAQSLRGRAQMREVPALTLKGKDAPVRAWCVEGLSSSVETTQPTPLIGRDIELAQLRQVYERSLGNGRGALVTVLGVPGVGKTRLLDEFLSGLGAPEPVVLRGRAQSFNRGVSYLPIVELLRTASAEWAAFVERASTDSATARAVTCLDGLSQRSSAPRHGAEVEELAWALRTFLKAVSTRRPLALVWEDLHWAEPALLDILEYLADELSDLPVLQLCTARHELADLRADWPTGGTGSLTIDLAPLTPAETLVLVSQLTARGDVEAHMADAVCDQVASASEGNPLFAELLLAMEGSSREPLPHTITAVFAARLDRLKPEDRRVLEIAAVLGRDFAGADIAYVLAEDGYEPTDLSDCLDRLRRTRMLTGSRISARHCFVQAFSRDTTYELSGKRSRLRWHLALVNRAEGRGGPLREGEFGGGSETLLTYHLEAAAMLSRQLHPTSAETEHTSRRASEQLAEQAADATDRKDLRSAAGLLERALGVLADDAPGRLGLTLWLSDIRCELGELHVADAVLRAWSPQPGRSPSDVPSLAVSIQREIISLRAGNRTIEAVLDAERRFEPQLRADDHLAWCRFHQLRSHRHLMKEESGAAERSLAAARRHAEFLGDMREVDRIDRTAVELAFWGPAPVTDGLARCRELVERFKDSRVSLVPILAAMAGFLALDSRFDEARDAADTAASYATELRMHSADAALFHLSGVIGSLAKEPERACRDFRRARDILATAGQSDGEALMDAYAARESVSSGAPVPPRYAELDGPAVRAVTDRRLGALVSTLAARSAADAGDAERLARLAGAALDFASGMDDLYFRGAINRDVAALRFRAGDVAGAGLAAAVARDCFLAKGARAATSEAEDLLALISDQQPAEGAL
ncbi:AAA family ATPase [Streptomyces sp. NBC_00441]|uniref:adenylate/guanylate cyclase domain-containing protein n=1 Tax=Streptomyces sp. NBC_00441 TaxID=2975742 RepID=UPI002E28F5C3|nr:adenylate/guanylate cyclase domain-containing protein [Streptomyces sp. NBC_00441]